MPSEGNMPDSKSSERVFFRLQSELLEALDALLPELREESMGEVSDRSKAVRYLLIAAIEERQRRRRRTTLLDEALDAVEERHRVKTPRSGRSRPSRAG
jgi:metal-responsive CopG/Arc/MetJ family transcriptional regulator